MGASADEQTAKATEQADKQKKAIQDEQQAAGLSAQAIQKNPINVQNFADPGSQQFAGALAKAENRPTPTVTASQVAPAAQATAAPITAPANVTAAQVANADTAQARAMQMDALNKLGAQAAGTAPSLASQAAKIQSDRAIAQQAQLMAQHGRGANAAAAMQNIARTAGEQQQQLNADLAMAKVAEQQQAQNNFASALSGLRGQDVSMAQTQAGLGQQAALANQSVGAQIGLAGAQLGTNVNLANTAAQNQVAQQNAAFAQQAGLANQGVAAQNISQLNQMGMQAAGGTAGLLQDQAMANYQAGMGNRGLAASQLGFTQQLGQDAYTQNLGVQSKEAGRWWDIAGGVAQGVAGGMAQGATKAATAAAMSDKNVKKNIKSDVKNEIDEFMASARGVSYDYKNPYLGEGKHVSPLAQELAKSEVGQSMVIDTPAGKMVDYGKGFGAMLATLNEHHEELKKLKGKKNA